ncbi:MAG: exonuclease III [Flavobacteriaceae bacterium]|jgi:exonuclease III|uniref:T9SS type A sorting domain-containing protein n=1 Tax=Candidatus Marifrigoribacter sp. Uisw_064 TaxID=3230970 RepID=UPI003ADD3A18
MIRRILFFCIILSSITVSSQEIVKTMFYNLLEFPSASPEGRSEILKNILNTYEPDIFMVCELENENGADQILNTSLNDDGIIYSRAPFVLNQSGNNTNLNQLLYFRNDKFILESTDIIVNTVRDINRYQLKLNTTDQEDDPVFIDLFVTHLKSSQGTANQNTRLEMVTKFTNYLETIDPDSFVIFAGDFNVYTQSEPAYQELLDNTNAIVLKDPINTPGSWHNNDTYQDIHTQSTRISSGPFGSGAGGGLDDRFDFILVSENMETNPNVRYISDTYKSYGNNGNCYNNDINNEDCIGDFNQDLRNDLYNMSDHLPVVMELETDKEFMILGNEDYLLNENLLQVELTVVKDKLQIKVHPSVQEFFTLEIYNTLGQKLIENIKTNSETISIDVSQLAQGIYYIKSSLKNSNLIKFIKTS